MFNNKLIIGLLVTFFFMGFIGTAFAENSNDTSILGTDQFSFDSQQSTNNEAAKNFDYNQEHLALVGTEAGNWKYNNVQKSKADVAATNYNYNQEHLALVGTEAGDWKINNSAQGVKGIKVQASEAKKQNAICSNC